MKNGNNKLVDLRSMKEVWAKRSLVNFGQLKFTINHRKFQERSVAKFVCLLRGPGELSSSIFSIFEKHTQSNRERSIVKGNSRECHLRTEANSVALAEGGVQSGVPGVRVRG